MRVRFPNGAPRRISSKVEPAIDNREVLVRFQHPAAFILRVPRRCAAAPSPIARAIRRSHWLTRLLEGCAVNRSTLATVCAGERSPFAHSFIRGLRGKPLYPRDSLRGRALTVRSLVLLWVTG